MTTIRGVAAFVLACLCAVPAGAAAPIVPAGAPAAAEAITRDLVDVPGAAEPHTPSKYNRAQAFRYTLPGAPAPSTVLVLIPGLNSGPNTLDILTRALLTAHGPGLEVWITSPRPTLLQDRRGVEAALAYQHPDFALGYYYGSLEIGGHRFRLLTGPDVPYMAYWGLDVHLRDIAAIVREVRTRFPRARVALGGHSLGGILAAAYAGYDFAEIPGSPPAVPPPAPEIGASHLAGLLFIDGLPLHLRLRLTPDRYLHGMRIPFFVTIPGVDQLTDPDPAKRASPFTRTGKLARTRDSILLDVVSVYAFLRPQAPSFFSFSPRFQRQIEERFAGVRGLRITNEALVAAIFSDQIQPDRLIRANVEVPVGIFARVKDPEYINPGGLLDLESGYPAPGESLIRLPALPQAPRPRVAIRRLIEAILRPGANFTEWYFPWRLVLDIGLGASLEPSDAFARQYIHLTHVGQTALPVLALGAGHGLIRSEGVTQFYRSHIATPPDRFVVKIFPDLSHLDIEDADPNPAVPVILNWLDVVVH